MTITGPTDAIFKAFSMIALKFEEVSKYFFFSLQVEIQTQFEFSHVCFNVKEDLFNVLFNSNESGYIFINAFGSNAEEE